MVKSTQGAEWSCLHLSVEVCRGICCARKWSRDAIGKSRSKENGECQPSFLLIYFLRTCVKKWCVKTDRIPQVANLKRTESPNPNIALLIWSTISPNLYHSGTTCLCFISPAPITSTGGETQAFRRELPNLPPGTDGPHHWWSTIFRIFWHRPKKQKPIATGCCHPIILGLFLPMALWLETPPKKKTKIKHLKTWNVPIQGAYWSNSSASALGTVHLVKKPRPEKRGKIWSFRLWLTQK